MDLNYRYQAALDYIYSFIGNSLTHQRHPSLENFDLSPMYSLVGILGNPQNDYPTIHVAGSKGKGSVSAFCATALETEGYKVGLYTSPHLKDFEERIQINREPISRLDFVDYIGDLQPIVSKIPGLNTFEIATALAFLYFSRQQVDVAVIEVGLGGRLDATNVITPLVSVITALYLEHTSILGNTLTQIAKEKAGIIKPGVPVVISPQNNEALQMVSSVARKQNSRLIQVGVDYVFKSQSSCLARQCFDIECGRTSKRQTLEILLLGQHQVENASTAYAALHALQDQGFRITEESIIEGFARTHWPARFEILREEPPVVVDSAHNPDSARKMRQTLEEYFPGRPIVLIFGVSEDKNIKGMIEEFLSITKLMICTQSTHPRAMDPRELYSLALETGYQAVAIEQVRDALEYALEIAGSELVVLATGSIFVAATVRIAWYEKIKNVEK